MNGLPWIGGAVLCALLSLWLKEGKSSFAVLPATLGGVMLLIRILASLSPLTAFFSFFNTLGLQPQVRLVGKVLGVGYLSEIGSDLCRELGAATLGSRVELFGRVEILLLCLPFLQQLLEKMMELLT